MDEKITKLFLPLLDKLYNTEPAGEPFRKPVDVVKYGCFDYYFYVKHPIDLSTIRQRLVEHQYKDAWRFVADIQLMFSNAYLFNKKGTPVYEFTNKLNKIWNSELTPIMQRLNYCCGTLHKFGPQLLFCHGTTSDRYCQIPIGAKYKCYEDQYSFCVPCFNKIESDYINIQGLSCETTRMKLPTQPVKKSDFADCTNDNWQYESFIQCAQCSRRVHQICDIYPADDDEIENCTQHDQIEYEQKMLCQVPEEYRTDEDTLDSSGSSKQQEEQANKNKLQPSLQATDRQNGTSSSEEISLNTTNQDTNELVASSTSLDDELLQFARDVEDYHSTNSAPTSPNPYDGIRPRSESAKDCCQKRLSDQNNSNTGDSSANSNRSSSFPVCGTNPNTKYSVDSIAARLSINKLTAEAQSDEHRQQQQQKENTSPVRDKFVCNHCYRKKKVGFNLRHRKFSARRLPHTRMSRYIETKVNEHIRENSPTSGEVTIRVLTAYRDTVTVKPEMRDYVNRCKQKDQSQRHPNVKDYPEEFGYTNRAIFAWQEIDCVDVCVFGMHVQEYGEDCPEPNKQVVYLSYLDSVHFFRPKQVRTAVYHEILLSYFKYVKKLGFRRVFIWVCPSRKGDDYIFYRHPTEQKMPTLKRLSDWYVNLLDKGVMAGIVERHQNIYQYVASLSWTSILSMPYLSGDYWPTEFERLLKIMIDYEKEYEVKSQQQLNLSDHSDSSKLINISEVTDSNDYNEGYYQNTSNDLPFGRNTTSFFNLYHKQPPNSRTGRLFNLKSSLINSDLKPSNELTNNCFTPDGDFSNISQDEESKLFGAYAADSFRSELDQPLDLSKASSNNSPESFYDDDRVSEISFISGNERKRRKKSASCNSRNRNRASSQTIVSTSTRVSRQQSQVILPREVSTRYHSQATKSSRHRSSTQAHKETVGSEVLLNPEEDLIKNLERSLKRQREGFIVARLNDCDCSPTFESQRRKEEVNITCDLMRGREPFLQLTRQKNYEFSTLRRAKFSSLAMVKHLAETFKLDPICNECFSFDSSKRHYVCTQCNDYYLCTSCHENTQHGHIMSLMAPPTLPDIDEFLQQCSLSSTTNSISSASSTISNKSSNDCTIELSSSHSSIITPKVKKNSSSAPLNRHISNTTPSPMPLSCQRQKNHVYDNESRVRNEDEENADICSFDSSAKLTLPHHPSPPPSHSANSIRNNLHPNIELDEVLVESFIRHAEVSYDVDFDQMKNESKKLLTHYWICPNKETCHRCKFVVLSCSFMNVLMRSSRMQMMINCNPSEIMPNNMNNSNHLSGVNLTTSHQFNYQPKDK